jgi:DNA polymerase III alpha subunit (gram-positive type)
MHYLGFDLETGGLDETKNTIMEAYYAIWDENWNLLEDLELHMTDDEGNVNAEQEALDITGINLEEHMARPDLVTYSQGRAKLEEMLQRHKIPKKRTHYRFLGQNIAGFDIPFMKHQGFMNPEQMKKAGINHNPIDTTILVTWLKQIGILPTSVGSIGSLIEYFGLPQGKLHSAKDDVLMQKEIYIRLCDIMRKSTVANLGSVDSDLLKIVEL